VTAHRPPDRVPAAPTGIHLGPAAPADLPEIEALVTGAGLTLAGLDACVVGGSVTTCRDEDGRLLGVAATERYGPTAFLRSVAVLSTARGQGIGRALVGRALADAHEAGVREAWLLTETAEPFFASLGWARADRAKAPAAVAASVEFTSACPTSAVAMARSL
jgi:N-acetylglutamate synthase-like GNAT family acetyltransferase